MFGASSPALAVSCSLGRRLHQPCVIFMDEIDAIGGRRFSEGTSADREIQRTLMELLNQMDGFDTLGRVKVIMATNRPDTLDPALLRPGRLDRKIGIPLPNEQGRLEVLQIHAASVTKHGDIGAFTRPLCVRVQHNDGLADNKQLPEDLFQHLQLDIAMGDGVELSQRIGVAKDALPELLAVQSAV